jgi:hypothetical protein
MQRKGQKRGVLVPRLQISHYVVALSAAHEYAAAQARAAYSREIRGLSTRA